MWNPPVGARRAFGALIRGVVVSMVLVGFVGLGVGPPGSGAAAAVPDSSAGLPAAARQMAAPETAEPGSTPSDVGVSSISAGDGHACGLEAGGSVLCWGSNSLGQVSPVPEGTYTSVSAGGAHSCAVRVDGTVACWGWNGDGRATPPAGAFRSVDAASEYTCGVRDSGTVACWGYDDAGQATPPAGEFVAVDGGFRTTCGVRADRTITCWGDNTFGQASSPSGAFRSVTTQERFSCGLRDDGTVTCWGNDAFGLLSTPAGEFRSIDAGWIHACGLRPDGTITCWGSDNAGQSSPPSGTYLEVTSGTASGSSFSCGVRDSGVVACWGAGPGQSTPPTAVWAPGSWHREALGPGSTAGHSCGVHAPSGARCWGPDGSGQASPPPGAFRTVAQGHTNSCGVGADGILVCWGDDSQGQSSPPAGAFLSVSAGNAHGCAVKGDSTVACWGNDLAGQASPPPKTFLSVSAGFDHSCGVTRNGTVACWGGDGSGQSTPPTGTFLSVATGKGHSCGLRTDGAITCWGGNSSGQVSPVPAGPFVGVATGSAHSCGVRADGSLACWGNDGSGRATPPATGTYTAISAGIAHSCALRTDGTVVCWGDNSQGAVSPVPRLYPWAQSITIDPLAEEFLGAPPATAHAVASSGLPVTFSIDPSSAGVCTSSGVNGATITYTGIGTCTVLADQAGNDDWAPAQASRDVHVSDPNPGPPTNVHATAERQRAFVSFDAPTWAGKGPIGSYMVVASPGGAECSAVVPDLSCTVTGLTGGVSYTFTATAWSANALYHSAPSAPSNAVVPWSGVQFQAVYPFRALDSRTATGGFGGPVGEGETKELLVAGGPEHCITPPGQPVPLDLCSVPATATAVVMNVSVTGGTKSSYLTAFPAGVPSPPTAASLLFAPNQSVPNLVTVAVGTGGKVAFFNQLGSVHVVADVVGYYDDGAQGRFTGVTPTRILDSRGATGGWASTPLGPGENRTVTARGANGVPITATSLVMNVTATGATGSSFLTVSPGPGPTGTASLLFAPNQTVPNLVTVAIAGDDMIRFYNQRGTVHVVADLVGYFDSTSGDRFHPLAPSRILDSRTGTGLSGAWGPNQSRTLTVAGVGGIDAAATAIVANLTVTGGTSSSYLALSPTPGSVPAPTANLLFGRNQTVPNLVAVKVGAGGGVDIYNQLGSVHVVADAAGYFAPL